MCNIAGYVGERRAAPILLEMLRRQQPYDGDMSTGVAVIHEGKLHYRKIVGDVDTLIRETDVLSLPGTIGIAHTRPSGKKDEVAAHPFLNMEETMAVVTNGTTPTTKYCADWDAAADLLDQNGYIVADETTKSSIPGVFAVGDVRTKPMRQIVTAVSDGAVAAHFAQEFALGK